MVVDYDLSVALNRVRAALGDPDSAFISDTVIQYLLENNNDNETIAIRESLKLIIAELSKRIDQEVDEVSVKFSQLRDHYRELLDDYLKNPNMMSNPPITKILGGGNKPDFKIGDFSDLDNYIPKDRWNEEDGFY